MPRKKDQPKLRVSNAPPPITPVTGSTYLSPKPVSPIPKPTDPKKTPRKKVQRELAPGHQSLDVFLRKVKEYTRGEFIERTPDYPDVPYFPEFTALDGIEVLRDVFNRLNKEFQDRNEIHWFLTSRWEGRFPELHIFLIACGIRKFILLHSEEAQEGNSGTTKPRKTETKGAVSLEVLDAEYYMKLVVDGKTFNIRAKQGKAIKHLHESHRKGSPYVPDETLKTVMGLSSTSRIKDSFRGKTSKPLWEALIIRKGYTLCLNI